MVQYPEAVLPYRPNNQRRRFVFGTEREKTQITSPMHNDPTGSELSDTDDLDHVDAANFHFHLQGLQYSDHINAHNGK